MNSESGQRGVLTGIGSLKDDMANSVRLAFARYIERNAEDGVDLDSRTKAGILRDYAIAEFAKITSTNPRVRKHTSKNLKVFIVDGKYMVRFKKLNRRLLSSNSRTIQALRFASQELTLFPNYSPITSLNLGYVVNDSFTDLDVYLTCPSGLRSISWASPLEFSEITGISVDIPKVDDKNKTTRMKPRINYKEASNDKAGSQ
jgi:hypothetical protein